tara:strand:+ start:573 stop:776 length:204 start_codon:yes stop_codon:yes gene_type:complete
MKYYTTQIQFETVNDENGRIQKTKENYIVEAESITKAEEKLKERFKDSMSDFTVIKVVESNIMGIIE